MDPKQVNKYQKIETLLETHAKRFVPLEKAGKTAEMIQALKDLKSEIAKAIK